MHFSKIFAANIYEIQNFDIKKYSDILFVLYFFSQGIGL